MIALILLVSLLIQGVPARPQDIATITGTVRDAQGNPAAGIRIAARIEGDGGVSLVSLTETDAEGRYRLENLPPGRFVISGGWVDLPTYYPGTISLTQAKPLTVASGSTISGIDFTLQVRSYSGVQIPIKLTIEGGTAVQPPANGKRAQLRLLNELNGRTVTEGSLDATSITVPFPAIPGLFLAVFDNLPSGYSVKSITYGPRDVRMSGLRLESGDLSAASPDVKGRSELAITLVAAPSTGR